MTDDQIEEYLSKSELSIRYIAGSKLCEDTFNVSSLKEHLLEHELEYWLVNGSEQTIKFFSKRSIVEWHIAKTSGVFDDVCKGDDDAT